MTIIPLVTSLRPKVHRAGRYRKSVSFTVCFPFAKRQSLSRYLLAYIISHLFVKINIFLSGAKTPHCGVFACSPTPSLSLCDSGDREQVQITRLQAKKDIFEGVLTGFEPSEFYIVLTTYYFSLLRIIKTQIAERITDKIK